MASNYGIVDEGIKDQYHHHYHQVTSPRSLRPSASSSPTSSGGGTSPKCVCAPATHAGSFKCRLHRTNSDSHDPHSPPAVAAAAAPPLRRPLSPPRRPAPWRLSEIRRRKPIDQAEGGIMSL